MVDELIEIGKLGRPWGVRGEQLFRPFNEGGLEFYQRFDRVVVDGRSRDVAGWREDGGGRLYLRLAGVDSPEAAKTYSGGLVSVSATELPQNPAGVYYEYQLIGLTVIDGSGATVGVVEGLQAGAGGANDVLVVRCEDGEEWLVPFVAAYVGEIDLDAGRLTVSDYDAEGVD